VEKHEGKDIPAQAKAQALEADYDRETRFFSSVDRQKYGEIIAVLLPS
jgi:hypothetical protein